MTTALERMGRAELLARVAELEAEKETTEAALRDTQRTCVHLVAVNHRLSGDHATMLETLSHAQARGSELLDETRALRRTLLIRLDQRMTAWGAPAAIATEQVNILVDLLKVRWKGDAKYGTAEAHADLPLGFGCFEGDQERADSAKKERRDFQKVGVHSWRSVIAEEFFETCAERTPEGIEREALDLANVCLKCVEATRIRRARTEAK